MSKLDWEKANSRQRVALAPKETPRRKKRPNKPLTTSLRERVAPLRSKLSERGHQMNMTYVLGALAGSWSLTCTCGYTLVSCSSWSVIEGIKHHERVTR